MCGGYDVLRRKQDSRIVNCFFVQLVAKNGLWLIYKNKRYFACSWMLTWPHTSSPNPINTHHIHWSSCRGEQLNGFPPNWTITIYKEEQRRDGVNTLQEEGKLSVTFYLSFVSLFVRIITPPLWFLSNSETHH